MTQTALLVALVAISTINHDGVLYGPGCEAGVDVELPEKDALPLIAAGAALRKEDFDAHREKASASGDLAMEASVLVAERDTALAGRTKAIQELQDQLTANEALQLECADLRTDRDNFKGLHEAAQAEIVALTEQLATAKKAADAATAKVAALEAAAAKKR